MALHNGIDTVAVISLGVYSKTYGQADGDELASLHTSFGLFESAGLPVRSFIGSMLLLQMLSTNR